MTCMIKLLERIDGVRDENFERFVVRYDPRLRQDIFTLETTADPVAARKFLNAGEALEYWRKICPSQPLRPDGQPNRPLTAWNAAVLSWDGL